MPQEKIISNGSYQAIKCGSNYRHLNLDKFIFDKENGYLFYYDINSDSFNSINKRVDKVGYFNSMEEFSSRLEKNKLIGNKLFITYIYYLDLENSNKLIAKKVIYLRWRIMHSSYKSSMGGIKRRINICIWLDPKKVNLFY